MTAREIDSPSAKTMTTRDEQWRLDVGNGQNKAMVIASPLGERVCNLTVRTTRPAFGIAVPGADTEKAMLWGYGRHQATRSR